MLFQLIDNKIDCVGYCTDGKLFFEDELPESLSKTWKYTKALESINSNKIEFANLYCGGLSFAEACPPHLQERLEVHTAKLKAFLRSFMEAKVSLNENCFFDLVPHKFLLSYYDVRNDITEHVFNNYQKPENYMFLARLSKVLEQVSAQPLNIDLSALKDEAYKLPVKNFIQKIEQSKLVCDYNIFGTKTGRLTTKKGTFPILTMDKKYRSVLKPTNDWFLEFDFNAAELRTILSLSNQEQPRGDIHKWNAKNIYDNKVTREEAKKKIFAWLYNPNSSDTAPDKYYDRAFLKGMYYSNGAVATPFGRKIEADSDHAINYLVQSTSSDNTLKQMYRLHSLLQNCESFVAFTMHDSVIIDLSHKEKDLIPLLSLTFSETALGNFEVNISAGPDYGNMREL